MQETDTTPDVAICFDRRTPTNPFYCRVRRDTKTIQFVELPGTQTLPSAYRAALKLGLAPTHWRGSEAYFEPIPESIKPGTA